MAAISQATMLYMDGGVQRTMACRILNVTTGDTIDLSQVGPVTFLNVQAAVAIDCQGNKAATVTIGAGANGGQTLLTITSSGLSKGTIQLLVIGEG